jgi:hypothetical protein
MPVPVNVEKSTELRSAQCYHFRHRLGGGSQPCAGLVRFGLTTRRSGLNFVYGFSFTRSVKMSKLLSTLIASIFAVATFTAAAQSQPIAPAQPATPAVPAKGDAAKATPATPATPASPSAKGDKPKTDKAAKSKKGGKKSDGKKSGAKKSSAKKGVEKTDAAPAPAPAKK